MRLALNPTSLFPDCCNNELVQTLVSGRIFFSERESFCENQMKLQKHILIVEDEPDAAELLELNLKNAGFKVTVAEDGDQALKKYISYCRTWSFLI